MREGSCLLEASWNVMAHAQKPDFVFRAKRTSPFKSAGGASVQSTAGSRGVRISGSNAGYTMFRGSVKSTGYPLHSPDSPSLPLPCVTVCHHISTALYLIGQDVWRSAHFSPNLMWRHSNTVWQSCIIMNTPVPVAEWSKAWVCGCSPADIVGSNPAGGMDICCECCVLSGRGLCDELITCPRSPTERSTSCVI